MKSKMPQAFASHLRRVRACILSLLLLLCLFIGAFCRNSMIRGIFIGVPIMPAVSLFFLLLNYRSPLCYVFARDGIYLQPLDRNSTLVGLNSSVASYWIDWRTDPIVAVERYHWRGLPALRIETRRHRRGKIVALESEDVEKIEMYMKTVCG